MKNNRKTRAIIWSIVMVIPIVSGFIYGFRELWPMIIIFLVLWIGSEIVLKIQGKE